MPIGSHRTQGLAPTEYLSVAGTASGRYNDVFKLHQGGPISGTPILKTVQGRLNNQVPSSVNQNMSISPNGLYLVVSESTVSPYVSFFKRVLDEWIRLPNPATIPTGIVYGIGWSSDNNYVALYGNGTPYLNVYSRSGDTFTKLTNPSTLPPSANGYTVAFNPSNTVLAVDNITSGSYPYQYTLSGSGSSTSLTAVTTTTNWTTGQIQALSYDATGNYMAIGLNTTPYVGVWKKSTSNNYFTVAASVPSVTANGPNKVGFNVTGNILISVPGASPYVQAWTFDNTTGNTAAIAAGNFSANPTGACVGISWSSDGQYLALAMYNSSPYFIVYSVSGSGTSTTFTKLSTTGLTVPAAAGVKVQFLPNSNYAGARLAVYHETLPYYYEYAIASGTMSNVGNSVINYNPISAINSGATNTTGGVSQWNSTGTYLAISQSTTPYINVYSRSGDTFTKLTNPGTLPTGSANGVAWSSTATGISLTVGHATTPFMSIYNLSGTLLTKISNPSYLPPGQINGVDYAQNGTLLAVGGLTLPYLVGYVRAVDTLSTSTVSISAQPAGSVNNLKFSPDGTALAVVGNTTPYLTVYDISGTTFTKVAGTPTLAGAGFGLSWSPDGNYLSIGMSSSPYLVIYSRSGDTYTALTLGSNPSAAVYSVAWSFDSNTLYAQANAGNTLVYTKTGTTLTLTSIVEDYQLGSANSIAYTSTY